MVTDSHGEALADDESKGVRQVSEKHRKKIQVFWRILKKPSSWGEWHDFWLVIFFV